MGDGAQAGIDRVVAALDEVLSGAAGSTKCLLETSAGGGAYVGAKFEDLAQILSRLPQHAERLGVCFDTAHAYASGYDDAGADGMRKTLDQLRQSISQVKYELVAINGQSAALAQRIADMEIARQDQIIAEAEQAAWQQAQFWMQHNLFMLPGANASHSTKYPLIWPLQQGTITLLFGPCSQVRSEERRVGTECRW